MPPEGTEARGLRRQVTQSPSGWRAFQVDNPARMVREAVVREVFFRDVENMDVFEEPCLFGFWQPRRREPVWATA